MDTDDSPLADMGVPPDEYDGGYFLWHCEGSGEFLTSRGRKLSARLRKALELANVLPGERVLDIGCGRGELVVQSALRGADAVGIDNAATAVRIAARALAEMPPEVHARASFAIMDARKLGFPDAAFDVAIMSDIVEHLYPRELRQALAETRRALKPGGRLVIHTSPNAFVYEVAYPAYIRHVHRVVRWLAELARYESFFIGPTLPMERAYPRTDGERRYHVNEQTAAGLARTLRESGFRVLKTEHREVPHGIELWSPFIERGSLLRHSIELMCLDAVRYLRPFSQAWPLNALFTNHIWMVAKKS